MLFVRFMFCLGVGLVGLSMVLMTVLETVFADWDVSADVNHFVRRRHNLLSRFLAGPEEDLEQAHGARLNAYGRKSRAEELAIQKRLAERAEHAEPAEPAAV